MRRLKEFLNWPELKREPPPRIAIAIVAVGLLACVVAAVATAGKSSGEAAHLEWVKEAQVPDSRPVEVPGGEQEMKLTDGQIRATGTNIGGYTLYQAAETLKFGAEAPLKGSRIICSMSVPHGIEIGHSGNGLRTLYPRSSEGIFSQEVPETLLLDFSSHGEELAVLEVGDYTSRWTNEQGVKLEWGTYETGTEHLKYFIAGKPQRELQLPFYAIWRSLGVVPKATTSCTVETAAGKATVSATGALKHLPPPIDEEAEEEEQERREEEEGETDEAGGEGE